MNAPATQFETHALKCEMAGEVLRTTGRLRLQVTGWSMLPSVWPGDVLIVERVSNDEVEAGDIVLFMKTRRLVAHRVVSRNSEVVTRGDANRVADAPVGERELLGKVSYILRNGRRIEPRKNPRFSERTIAAFVKHSTTAARVVVGLRELGRPRRNHISQD